jgi:hypothetical protein
MVLEVARDRREPLIPHRDAATAPHLETHVARGHTLGEVGIVHEDRRTVAERGHRGDELEVERIGERPQPREVAEVAVDHTVEHAELEVGEHDRRVSGGPGPAQDRLRFGHLRIHLQVLAEVDPAVGERFGRRCRGGDEAADEQDRPHHGFVTVSARRAWSATSRRCRS